MSYQNTFIQIAPDSNATSGTVPAPRGTQKTVPLWEFELLSQHPYEFTRDELLFRIHLERQDLMALDEAEKEQVRAELFSKPHPCLRASALPKRYGWGVHHDAEGRIAIYAVDSAEYTRLSDPANGLQQLKAMRSSRQ